MSPEAHNPECTNKGSWKGLLLLYAVALVMLIVGWNRTADIVVDFGRELYVPWQMTEGAKLYNDLEYFNGPFSPLVNSGLFYLFGHKISVLVLANFSILLAILTILYFEFGRFQSNSASILQGLCLIVFAGFNHTSAMGNFNLITPYSHETTHGLFLSVVIFALLRTERIRSWMAQLAVGFCFGWVLLTKAEFALACSAMLVATLVLTWWQEKAGSSPVAVLNRLLKLTMIWSAGSVVAIGCIWLILQLTTGGFDATQMLGSFRWITGSSVTKLAFYKKISGTDTPFLNLLWSSLALLSLCLILIGLKILADRGFQKSPILSLICFIAALIVGQPVFPVLLNGRMFTLFGFVAILAMVATIWRSSENESSSGFERRRTLLIWSVFALAMLAKMALNPMLDFYGFILATPMAIALVSWVLVEFPSLTKFSGRVQFVQAFLVGLILLDLFIFAGRSIRNMTAKQNPIASSERIYCDHIRAIDINEAIDYLDGKLGPDETVLVLPEGVTLNFLLRRNSGVRYYNFMPPELVMFGEKNIVESLRDRPPDYVVLLDRPVDGYQMPPFGTGNYGVEIFDWVQDHYSRIKQLGGGFRSKDGFGLDVYRRNQVTAMQPGDTAVNVIQVGTSNAD